MGRNALCSFYFLGGLAVCLSMPALAQRPTAPLSVQNDRILDPSGRQVFLWGMNVGEKSSSNLHQSWHGPEDFHNLRRWGMNAVRMMIFWSALEPEPGRYDETYLASVDERIGWARDAGLYVILDMHQDLWSAAIPGGNGAPAWATLDGGQPHFTIGDIWSTAYYVSPRVHRVFDNFWNNTPGPDGTGIQERYALAWRHVAARYANRPEVIGFDLMNEPFPGSMIQETAGPLLDALPALLRDVPMPDSLPRFIDSITENPLPPWLLDALDDPGRHRIALETLRPVMGRFERDMLMPMYRRVHRAIREVNATGIIFLEPCVLANIGVPSEIVALHNSDGVRDPQQAYLPHAYDIVTDTPLSGQPSENRLNLIVTQKRRDAERLGMPLLIGEWGAYYGSPKTRDAARMMNRLLEENVCGAFYWEYHRHLERAVYFEVLSKPAPLRLAGALESFSLSPGAGIFSCRWENTSSTGDSLFALPESWPEHGLVITTEPAGLRAVIERDSKDPKTRYVTVSATDAAATTTLTLRISPPVGGERP